MKKSNIEPLSLHTFMKNKKNEIPSEGATAKKDRGHTRIQSFVFAARGLKQIFLRERNFRIQLFLMLLSFSAAYLLKCSAAEWIAIVICCAVVLMAEAANTIFEELTDWIHEDYHERAGRIKDMAASIPLIASFFALATGIIIFAPKIWSLVNELMK